MKRFNLNNYILVKLEDKGFEHWMNKNNSIFERFPSEHPVKEHIHDLDYFKSKANSEGYVLFQAWDFIRIFGDVMKMGTYGYINMDILIDEKYLND